MDAVIYCVLLRVACCVLRVAYCVLRVWSRCICHMEWYTNTNSRISTNSTNRTISVGEGKKERCGLRDLTLMTGIHLRRVTMMRREEGDE